jgi:hypothetical protein
VRFWLTFAASGVQVRARRRQEGVLCATFEAPGLVPWLSSTSAAAAFHAIQWGTLGHPQVPSELPCAVGVACPVSRRWGEDGAACFDLNAPSGPRAAPAWLGLGWLGLAWLGLAWLSLAGLACPPPGMGAACPVGVEGKGSGA